MIRFSKSHISKNLLAVSSENDIAVKSITFRINYTFRKARNHREGKKNLKFGNELK